MAFFDATGSRESSSRQIAYCKRRVIIVLEGGGAVRLRRAGTSTETLWFTVRLCRQLQRPACRLSRSPVTWH